jgi:hypothetical protein
VGTEDGTRSASVATQFGKLLEAGDQALALEFAGRQQVERIVVGGAFLGLGKLRVDEFLGKVAGLRLLQAGERRIAAGRRQST